VLQSHARVDDAIRRELQSMDWDMLRDLTRNGCTVGSHTRSHTLLGTASRAVMKVELEGSRRDLERQLQTPIRHLAYPDGSYNASALEAVRAAGYETACTTDSRAQPSAPTLTLPRRMLWEGACMDSLGQFSPAILSCQVNGVFDVLAAPSLGGEQ
jgi:peptidoglycan/xylan/chitin deacetylase (PgdA/CDA1 family)